MSALGSCHFYSHCIESKFPCGDEGLVLSYAEQRCNAIKKLRSKRQGRECPSCVSIIAFKWAHQVEQCFQERLLVLLQEYESRGLYHDPIVCLGWEREAALAMNYCYNQSSNIHVDELSDEDIKTLDSKFRIGGEYYNAMVDRGLPLVVKERRSALAAELVRVPSLVRLVYCIRASKYESTSELVPSHSDYIQTVRHKVNNGQSLPRSSLPLSNFHYGGRDDQHEDHPCTDHQPIGINPATESFHLVTLFVENSNTPIDLKVHFVRFNLSNTSILSVMFELTSAMSSSSKPPRRMTECGDGRRLATEECDYGGDTAMGCSINCRMEQNYDCETERLQPSVCKLEVCGDGMRTLGEACDDGNSETGDGCNNLCRVENATHICTRSYNKTSSCRLLSLSKVNQNRYYRSSITSRQASPSFSSREGASAHESSKRTLQPLPASSTGSRSVSISWIVPCVMTVLAASLIFIR